MKVEDAISRYIDYITHERRMSDETVRAYSFEVIRFGQYLTAVGISDVSEITIREARDWQAQEMQEGKASRSVLRMLSALRGLSRFLRAKQLINADFMLKSASPKVAKVLPVFFREGEVEHLYDDGIFPATFEGLRDSLLLRMLYETGIRRSEAASLTLASVDLSARTLKVFGKRRKERYIPLENELLNHIDSYLAQRETIPCQDNYLFVSGKGKKLCDRTVYDIVQRYMTTLSSADRISPHVFRHTFATHILNEGGNIVAVKNLLGHSSLNTTAMYAHVTLEYLKSSYNHAHPRATKKRR